MGVAECVAETLGEKRWVKKSKNFEPQHKSRHTLGHQEV